MQKTENFREPIPHSKKLNLFRGSKATRSTISLTELLIWSDHELRARPEPPMKRSETRNGVSELKRRGFSRSFQAAAASPRAAKEKDWRWNRWEIPLFALLLRPFFQRKRGVVEIEVKKKSISFLFLRVLDFDAPWFLAWNAAAFEKKEDDGIEGNGDSWEFWVRFQLVDLFIMRALWWVRTPPSVLCGGQKQSWCAFYAPRRG